MAGIGGLSIAYALIEAQAYTLRRVTVPLLGGSCSPLTILHLSDLHMAAGRRGRRRAAWVRRLESEAPDLVVLTGDDLACPDGLPVVLDALGPFLDGPGAFVFGSNDYVSARWHNPARYVTSRLVARGEPEAGQPVPEDQFDLPWTELRAALCRAGWFDLNNARASAVIGGQNVRMVGLDDPHIARDALPAATGKDGGPMEEGGAGIVLGVVHAPYQRALRALADDGAQLILAGHTHGGQLTLPGHGALVANCDVGTDRARGLHGWPGPRPDEPGGEESVWLHVSAGLGTSPYVPLRVAARPEATLLTLTPRNTTPEGRVC
jgi:predicted MPP superfamily phosphohydrolase